MSTCLTAGLLHERIIDELLLEEEVLVLLFPHSEHFLILTCIQHPELVELLLPLLLRVNRVQNVFPGSHPGIVTLVFIAEELQSLCLLAIEIDTLGGKSIDVSVSMILYCLVCSFIQHLALLLHGVVLGHDEFTMMLKLAVRELCVPIKVPFLSLKHISAS